MADEIKVGDWVKVGSLHTIGSKEVAQVLSIDSWGAAELSKLLQFNTGGITELSDYWSRIYLRKAAPPLAPVILTFEEENTCAERA